MKYEPTWLKEDVVSIVYRMARKETVSEEDKVKVWESFGDLSKRLFIQEISERGIAIDDSHKEEMIEEVRNHLYEYSLPTFEPEKWNGKPMNYFSLCGKRHYFMLTKRYFYRTNPLVQYEVENEDGETEELALNVDPSIQPETDAEQLEILDKQRAEFEEFYKFFTTHKKFSKRYGQVAKELKELLEGKRQFVYRPNGTNIYLYGSLTPYSRGEVMSNTMKRMREFWRKYKATCQ